MDNSKSLIDRVKNGVRTLAVGTAIGLATLAYSPKADADPIPIDSFGTFMGTQGNFQSVFMDYDLGDFPPARPPFATWDNLMIRDLETGGDSVVSKRGYYNESLSKWVGDVWRIGFVKYDGADMFIGGYANNDNPYSNFLENNLPGWCGGEYTDNVFAEGETADEVLIVYDRLGDGMGNVDGGVWTLGDDDTLYTTADIEFNGIRGDISELGAFNYAEEKILPQMTIVPKRFAGMDDLVRMAENWLRQDCDPYDNANCNGADWNYNRVVNLYDFAELSKNWEPDYVKPPRTGPADMIDLVAMADSWLRQDCDPYDNANCNRADWNYDGVVNLKDYVELSNNWDP